MIACEECTAKTKIKLIANPTNPPNIGTRLVKPITTANNSGKGIPVILKPQYINPARIQHSNNCPETNSLK